MPRILIFLLVVFGLGLGFAWLADRPGDLAVTFQGYRYESSIMVAAIAVTVIAAATMIIWWLVKAVWTSPYTISRYFRVRKRDRGYQALSTGIIAAGSGDAALARRKSREAARLISADREPLIHLLDAQASLLEGDHDGARKKFEAMLDDPEMRLLGLRGLYLEANRLGDREVARHYADRAAAIAPQLSWAADVALGDKTLAGDWDGALALLNRQKNTHQIDRIAANRRRAVLLTAKAMAVLDSDPQAAKKDAMEANRLAPTLTPAALTAAQALFRLNDLRKGIRILEAIWKIEPHPEIGEAYIRARPGDSSHDRLSRAKRLQSLHRNNVESSLVVARAALDAGELKYARQEAEAAIRLQPREAAYLLLADIEEAETADRGRVRQLLAKAMRAPRDPAWVADGYVSDRWAPCSPVTGELDAFKWRAPVELLGQVIERDGDQPPDLAEDDDLSQPDLRQTAGTTGAPKPPAKTAAPSQGAKAAAEPTAPLILDHADVEPSPGKNETGKAENKMPLPDDPGVEPEENSPPPRRFGLF